MQCGYSLRGLSLDGRCPECNRTIADSLRGNRFKYCAPDYLASVHSGVVLAEMALTVEAVSLGAGIAWVWTGRAGWLGTTSNALAAGSVLLSLVAWWLVTQLNEGYTGPDTARGTRLVVRVSAIVTMVAHLFIVVPLWLGAFPRGWPGAIQPSAWPWFLVAGSVGWFVGAVAKYFASLVYLRWLAPRFPDPVIARWAGRLLWAGPLVVGVLTGAGILAAMKVKLLAGEVGQKTFESLAMLMMDALFFVLLERVRRGLKQIRRAKDETKVAAI